MQPVYNLFRRSPGQGRDTVVALHAAIIRMISGLLKCVGWKILVLDLRFLQTHHIGLVLRDPVENDREPLPDGINVVGGDLHDAGEIQLRLSSIQCQDEYMPAKQYVKVEGRDLALT